MNNCPTRCGRVSLWRVRCAQLAAVGDVVVDGVCEGVIVAVGGDGVVVAEDVLLAVGDALLGDPDG
jgi:hypothetical protein